VHEDAFEVRRSSAVGAANQVSQGDHHPQTWRKRSRGGQRPAYSVADDSVSNLSLKIFSPIRRVCIRKHLKLMASFVG
jgi:hypothetical protein